MLSFYLEIFTGNEPFKNMKTALFIEICWAIKVIWSSVKFSNAHSAHGSKCNVCLKKKISLDTLLLFEDNDKLLNRLNY